MIRTIMGQNKHLIFAKNDHLGFLLCFIFILRLQIQILQLHFPNEILIIKFVLFDSKASKSSFNYHCK